MEPVRPTTLYLICGKIGAGKSTLARQLATRPATLLITMDDWMSILFPTENRTIEDFTLLSARLRAVMGPHVIDILRQELSVVLDFPANTVRWRAWMRSLISEANVAHELHVLDIPDAICKERLRRRNNSGKHQYAVDEATYDQFMSYFVLPTADEGFNVVFHTY
jgi:predicted kinase